MCTGLSLLAALALFVGALTLTGEATAYVNGVGLLLVIAGSLIVTAVSFRPDDLAAVPGAVGRLAFGSAPAPDDAGLDVIELADRSRREGVLALQEYLPKLAADSLLAGGLSLLIDGETPDEVEKHMRNEASTHIARDGEAVDVLRRLGEVAPAMGLIGTLIGLVSMLTSLNDPSAIGPAMAIALLTTLYGVVLAHMVVIPLAAKAQRSADAMATVNEVYTLGLLSIGRQENPRRLEMAINAILPPGRRIAYFD